eukprot:scaffold27056_cov140-Skeletonema_menzelii.AAC.8
MKNIIRSKQALRGKPRHPWLHSSIFLVVACYANVILAADDRLEKLLLSSGGSRHRLSMHRKKSERHRHLSSENVYPMPEEQLIPKEDGTPADELEDEPSARRSLRDLKKDNKRHNRIKVRANEKDDEPNVKRGPIKDRKRSQDDKKMKKDDGAEKDKKKKDKHIKSKDDAEKREKKKGIDKDKKKNKKAKSDGKDGLLHKTDGNYSSWGSWDLADDDEWESADDWGHLGCICDDWWAPSDDDWDSSPDEWESPDDWSDSTSLDWTSSTKKLKMKKKLKKRSKKNNRELLAGKEDLHSLEDQGGVRDGFEHSMEEPLIRDLTSLAQ